MQLEILIGNEEVRKTTFKWNVSHLQDTCNRLEECWNKLLEDASFFSKMRHITRIYKQLSKNKTRDYKKGKLNLKASNLEVYVATLHEDVYNVDKHDQPT